MFRSLLFVLVGLGGFAACDPGTPVPTGRPVDAGAMLLADFDGDDITDADEQSAVDDDFDGDGIPNWRDQDSDDDGLLDRDEAGDDNPASPPVDSDGDGNPDYVDTDSDDNGILDGDERFGDSDEDGLRDYRDLDDDNDGLPDAMELAGGLDPRTDTDGDGTPNLLDRDSDNDLILDGVEFGPDTDGDGTPDIFDLDSDGDSLPDQFEAGDDDLDTLPVDTDMDGAFDFRDVDSDADGLSDRDESMTYMTDPLLGDTDGDGTPDLIEVGAGTSATDPADNPAAAGNFFFLVPFEEAPTPEKDTLSFRTSIQFADVYFLFDRSGSMSGEIGALRGAVRSIIGQLTCRDTGTMCMADDECAAGDICSPFSGTCIEDPSMSRCVASVWTGAGRYESRYDNVQSLQPDPARTESALGFSTSGSDEDLYEAVEQVARGGRGSCSSRSDRVGCPGFRPEAVKILVTFTDEDSDGGSRSRAAQALRDVGITMIGVWSGSPGAGASNDLRAVVRDSGSFRADGTTPLFYNGADSAVVGPVTTAINEVVEGVPLRVTIAASDLPDDDGDALQFIERLSTNTTSEGCSDVPVRDRDMDGHGDLFPAVTPGLPVCFDVIPTMNTTAPPTESPQVFKAQLTVSGDGSPLDQRDVYFLVPPRIEGPGVLE